MTFDEVLEMGRPKKKQVVEYFPHYVKTDSRTRYILETKWGNDGYAFWFKLLELLGLSEGHYYDYSKPVDKMYLVARANVSEEVADEILNLLAEQGKIDKQLWDERKIIWCQGFVDNLQELYNKRVGGLPCKPGSEEDLESQEEESEVPEPVLEPVQPVEVKYEEPEKKPELVIEKKKRKTRPRKNSELDPEQQALFVEFYEAYPKHVDVARAEVAWGKIRPEPDEEFLKMVLAKIEEAKKYDSRFREFQFIPNPASWLNAKAYKNDYKHGGTNDFITGSNWNSPAGNSGFEPSGGFRG